MKSEELKQNNHGETVTISCEEYERFQAQSERITKLEDRVEFLMEALHLAQHKRFGASSEKTDEAVMEQMSYLFNEAEVFASEEEEEENPEAEAEPEAEPAVSSPEQKRRRKAEKNEYTLGSIPDDIPVEVIDHTLEGEELICPECGETMTEIGIETVRKLKVRQVVFVVEEHRYHTYACQNCNKENIETPVVKAPREKSIIPGSFATPEAIAHIMTQKFVMGCPLYR